MSRRTKATRKGESNSDLEVEKDTPKPKQSASKTYVKAATIELSEQTQKDDMAGSRSQSNLLIEETAKEIVSNLTAKKSPKKRTSSLNQGLKKTKEWKKSENN